jgi:hypothetical protein
MGNPAAVTGLASAIAGLVKLTAGSITESVKASQQSLPLSNASEQWRGGDSLTVTAAAVARKAFPAVVPVLAHALLASIAEVLVGGAAAWLCGLGTASQPATDSDGDNQPISTTAGGSCATLQQCKTSIMLLTVLVGRSLVVLADAMEAAAAAAGTTPAQLFAR